MHGRSTRTVMTAVAIFLLGFAAGSLWSEGGSGSATTTRGTGTPAAAKQATQAATVVRTPARSSEKPTKEGTGATITSRRWSEVWKAGGDGFRGDPVELAGLVRRDSSESLLVYGNPSSKSELAEVYGSYAGIRTNDYVFVKGTIGNGATRADGGHRPVRVVTIDGVSVNPIGRDRALALAGAAGEGRHELGLIRSAGGLRVTLRWIEWTAGSTRLAVTVKNGSSKAARLDVAGAVIQQGPRQFPLSGSDKGAPGLSKEIGPRSSRSETLTFGQISRKRGKAYIGFDSAGKQLEFILRWTS
jgi:hypothetical protein